MQNNRVTRATLYSAGLFYLAVTLTMFIAPQWFYENIGRFPPYNRHYMGDVASFTLPLALGLLIAARDPVRHRLIIGLAAVASVVHTLNHVYDAIVHGHTHGHWLLDFTPLVLLAAALAAAYYRPSGRSQVDKGASYESGRAI